ncbi:lytic murein transglycosylase [Cellvibrio mixtus]|uniref:lytic murein transglycosylase n=1 Tax=Cellvibrio mixtus TaxID=39650 RepID=UPI0005865236|nr:lytic murein transglycosylase [Cellvibrio mixtus]
MKSLRNLLPFVCCMSLISCAQAPDSASLHSESATVIKSESRTETSSSAATIKPLSHIISEAEFSTCIDNFSAKAKSAGISSTTINRSLRNAKLNTKVIELDRKQPEFTTSFADYFNRRVTDQRVNQGRALLNKHADLLKRIEQQYGVPAPYLLAFWGLETNYGSFFGNIPVVDSLATLACDARRSNFFTIELINALRILDAGDIAPDKMIGSWAGAMGHVQFMPTSFLQNAVDFDGDHKRDLWNSTPDALASAAKFLQSLGWQPEERWGREVKLPNSFPFLEAGLKNNKPISEWVKLGVKRADNSPLPQANINASLLVPSGHQGPAFLAYDNFNVIMRWNRSEFYAIAVGQLADQIAGAGKLVQSPPEDAPRLHRDQVITLQEQLNQKGFNTGTPDGILGPGTRRAIGEFQHQQGMIADGFPGKEVLALLGINVDKH